MPEKIGDVTLPEIVAVMVHDLNNPIAALGTNLRFLENLVGPSASSDVGETLSDMQMLCDILRRLTRNLGMLGQGEAPPARRLKIDLVALAMGSVERMQQQAEASELKLALEAAWQPGEVFVEKDPDLCERALDNLLAFAVERATSRSSIVVSVIKTGPIGVMIRYTARPETVETTVQPSRSRALQSALGRGLSMHCARFAAEATGGAVEVRRDERDTTTLTLRLHADDKQIA